MAISHLGTGSAVFGVNDITPTIPATGTPAAGDMMLLLVGGKPFNATFGGSMAPGWTQLGSPFTDGSVAAGTDTGSMLVTAWWKEHDGSEANPLVDEGGTAWNIMGALVMVFRKGAGETWETPLIVGGGDASAGTGFSVTAGSNPGVTAGDVAVTFGAFRSDAATPCSNHLDPTQTGVTFSHTHDPATDPETTSGGDMGMCITRSAVTSGTGSAAPVLAATLAASHTGAAAFIRLRVAAAPPVVITATAATMTFAASVTDPTPAELAVQSSPAALSLSAQTVNPVQAALAVQASPALLTFSASALNPITPRIVLVSPALLSLTAQATDPTPAPLVISTAPALLTFTAQEVVPIAVIAALPALLTLTAQTVTPTLGALVVTASPASLSLTPQAASPQLAAFSLDLTPALLTLTASAVQLPGQPIVIVASPGLLIIAAQSADPTLGALVVSSSPAALDLTAQVVTAVLAAYQTDLTPAVLTLTAGAVHVSQGAQYRIIIGVRALRTGYQEGGASTKWLAGSPSGQHGSTTLGGRWKPGSLRRHM
jgi:hypothetical protein